MISSEFRRRLNRLIGRLLAWQFAERDAGINAVERLALELRRLRESAPSDRVGLRLQEAADALDDGLPPDRVAAALYQAGDLLRHDVAAGKSQPSDGRERLSPKRGRS